MPQVRTPTTAFQPPKISTFSGDPKPKLCECNFECWEYEVTCLLKKDVYSHQILTPIIRSSLQGEAGLIARYMGSQGILFRWSLIALVWVFPKNILNPSIVFVEYNQQWVCYSDGNPREESRVTKAKKKLKRCNDEADEYSQSNHW